MRNLNWLSVTSLSPLRQCIDFLRQGNQTQCPKVSRKRQNQFKGESVHLKTRIQEIELE